MAEFTPQQITWLERYMRLQVGRQVQQASSQIASVAQPVGFWLIVPDDLTANAAEYVYTHPVSGLTFLFCNGAAVSQTTYSTLYSLWGTNKYGSDSGGNFVLPDARGRSLWLAGTNAATDVGDNDGVTEASRQPKHTHAVTDPGHVHSITVDTGNAGSGGIPLNQRQPTSQSTQDTESASTGITVGSGMVGTDAVAHIVLGSLVVRF